MDLNQLQYFIQVAHDLHFARAASKLGITQPSLSRGIQNLEQELGVSLFSRSNKWHVELTSAGRAYLPEAEKAFRQLKNAETLARAAHSGDFGRLTVGAISSALGKREFVDTLSVIGRRYSGVTIEVSDSNSVVLSQQIRERSLDLVLIRSSPELVFDDELACEKVYDDELLVVLPARHRLARTAELPVKALAGERFIMVPARTSPAFHSYVCGFCMSHGGFTPLVSDEMSSSYAALHMVEAGLGITMVSKSYCGLFEDRLCYRRFSDFHPFLPVYAVYARDNDSLILHRFLDIFKERLNAETSGEGHDQTPKRLAEKEKTKIRCKKTISGL